MEILLKHQPVGQLAEIIKEFILFKRTQGFKYVIEENTLYHFSVFSTRYTFAGKVVPENMLSDWFKRRPGEKVSTQHSRCSSTKVFLRYAIDYGYKVFFPEIPKFHIKKYVPYISPCVRIVVVNKIL
jgi:hypothetical protein